MKRLLSIVFLLAAFTCAEAKLTVSDICTDGMVLQQKSEATVWGTCDPRSQVTVTPSWNGKAYTCKADKDGRWRVAVETPEGSYEAYTMTVSSGNESVTVSDILVGEVWFASGQSNMEMPMRGFYNSPIEHAQDFVCAPAATEKIRMFTVPVKQSYEPLTEVDAEWKGAE